MNFKNSVENFIKMRVHKDESQAPLKFTHYRNAFEIEKCDELFLIKNFMKMVLKLTLFDREIRI